MISTFSLLFAYCLPQFCISFMPSILCSPCLHRIFWWVCQKCSNHTVSSSRRVWLEQNHVPSPIDSMFWFRHRMKIMKWCLLSWIKRYYSGVLLPRFVKTCWTNDVVNMGPCLLLLLLLLSFLNNTLYACHGQLLCYQLMPWTRETPTSFGELCSSIFRILAPFHELLCENPAVVMPFLHLLNKSLEWYVEIACTVQLIPIWFFFIFLTLLCRCPCHLLQVYWH